AVLVWTSYRERRFLPLTSLPANSAMHRHSALVSHIVAGRMRRKTSTSCDTSSGGGSCPGRSTGRSPLHRMHLHPRRLCERSDPTASNWLLDEAELRGGYRGSQGPGAFRGRSASVRSHPRTGQRAISSSQSTTGQDQTRRDTRYTAG